MSGRLDGKMVAASVRKRVSAGDLITLNVGEGVEKMDLSCATHEYKGVLLCRTNPRQSS
jgi:hypothetical protein